MSQAPPPQENHFQAQPEINFSSADSLVSAQLSAFMAQVSSRLSRLESAMDEIARLNAALSASEAARKALEDQVASLTRKSSPVVSLSVPAAPTPVKPSSGKSAAAPRTYAEVAVAKVPKKRKSPAPPSAKRAAATISRLFAPPSDIPQGYQYVYYHTSARRPVSEMRLNFQALGLNNARILDIQYPVGNVISLLLHNDYVLECTSTLNCSGRGASPFVDFDPLDPVNLKDPQFASLSVDLRAQKAREIENLRCLRSLSFVRRSVRVSVACSFLEKDRINQNQFNAVLADVLAARSSPAPSSSKKKSSDEERLAKKQRLRYLSYLLHHDEETARLLAYTPSPALSPTGLDDEMKDLN